MRTGVRAEAARRARAPPRSEVSALAKRRSRSTGGRGRGDPAEPPGEGQGSHRSPERRGRGAGSPCGSGRRRRPGGSGRGDDEQVQKVALQTQGERGGAAGAGWPPLPGCTWARLAPGSPHPAVGKLRRSAETRSRAGGRGAGRAAAALAAAGRFAPVPQPGAAAAEVAGGRRGAGLTPLVFGGSAGAVGVCEVNGAGERRFPACAERPARCGGRHDKAERVRRGRPDLPGAPPGAGAGLCPAPGGGSGGAAERPGGSAGRRRLCLGSPARLSCGRLFSVLCM